MVCFIGTWSTAQKKIIVYTTADNTSLRITATDSLMFSDFGQPLETQPCVFVDPSKTFQTFIGIGGAGPSDGSLPASAQAIAALRATLRDGSQCCALGSVSGRPAGVGRCLFEEDGLGEISSIVTLSEWRRRGVAASVVSLLIRQLIETGRSIAWLNAANEQARALYAGLGFRSIGSLLNYEDEEPRPDRDVERA